MTAKQKTADNTKEMDMENQKENEIGKETSLEDNQKKTEKTKASGSKKKTGGSSFTKTKKKSMWLKTLSLAPFIKKRSLL